MVDFLRVMGVSFFEKPIFTAGFYPYAIAIQFVKQFKWLALRAA
jgi:hypothetical protein